MLERIRKGDIVVRKSYEKDVFFLLEEIIEEHGETIAILKGLTIRIWADSPLNDLEKVPIFQVQKALKQFDDNLLEEKIKKSRQEKREYSGRILHLDGDRRYAEKSERFYRKNRINAIVKNIKESEQARLIEGFVEKYRPDVVVITGHDGMIRKKVGYNDLRKLPKF